MRTQITGMGTIVFAITFLFISLTAGQALSDSSCIRCHTNEKMLKKNLAPQKEKKSSLSSGKG